MTTTETRAAPLKRALEGAERALFSNAGQLCISVERLFVHEAIADETFGPVVTVSTAA